MSKSKSEPKHTEATKPMARVLFFVLLSLVVVLGLIMIGYATWQTSYNGKVFAGVTMAGQDISGYSEAQVTELLDTYASELTDDQLVFTYEDTTLKVPVESDGVPLVAMNVESTVNQAMQFGRGNTLLGNLNEQFTAMFSGYSANVQYDIQDESILDLLQNTFAEFEEVPVDAQFVYEDETLAVTDSQDGTVFNWDGIMEEVHTTLANLKPVEFDLVLESVAPAVTTSMAKADLDLAEEMLSQTPLTFTFEGDEFIADEAEVATWLIPAESSVELDDVAIDAYLDSIAGDIDEPAKEGRFALDIVNGEVKLTQFEEGADGKELNTETVMPNIESALYKNGSSQIALELEVTHPRTTPENLENLGIKELLGTGHTNFAGSPSNRILNIRKGADLLNGLLIAPGETFSLLDILKPIDIEHGWFSELVIKGDKLEKEAGGGLCQVGSTSFRAAMLSGLPIVERRNHSWAISYYAFEGKAGVDATIYDPAPDFKFLNDTGHYILWRSRIEGSNIYFEFWGTSDGRKGTFTTPTNYNFVSPGPTIETVDPTLAPGERNCDGHAFTGVTASFDYTVEHPDGTKDTETFTSVYKARPQLCLVGPDAPAAPAEEDTEEEVETPTTNTNTSTNTNTTTNTNKPTNTNKSNKNTNKN